MQAENIVVSRADMVALLSKGEKAILSIQDIMDRTGWGRSKVYDAINSGRLETIKDGRRRGSTINQFNRFLDRLETEAQGDD